MSNKAGKSQNGELTGIEKRYNAFIDSSEDGIWCYEAQEPISIKAPENQIIKNIFKYGILVECNQAFAKMHSFKSVEAVLGTPLEYFLDISNEKITSIITGFIRNNFRLTNVEYRCKYDNADEKVFIVNLFGVVENNHLVQTWGVQRDITAQTRAQEKLIRSENRYRNIFNYAFDAIFVETLDGTILTANKRASDMLGYSQEEFLNMNIRQLLPENSHHYLPEIIDTIKKDGVAVVRSQNRHKNGHYLDVEICAKLLPEDDRELVHVFVRDISQHIRAQQKIQSLSAQIEEFSQISADIITITNEQELFRRISDAIVEISDFSRVLLYTFKDTPPYRDILGHVGISNDNLNRIKKAEAHKEKYIYLFENGIRLGNQSCYIPHTMKHLVNQHTVDYGKKDYTENDEWHREDNLLVALKNKSGDIIGMISLDDSKSGKRPGDETVKPIELFANHISQILKLKQYEEEQRQIEQRFQQSEKLRALGEMAGGVAHDFNNVLSAILGRAQLLKRDVNDPEILHGLEIIEKAAIDGAETIKRIQEFTRLRTDKKFARININDTIRDSIKFTRTRWKDDSDEKGICINIETHFSEDLYTKASSSEMREVFTNLILNSIEAMPDGGTIKITTDSTDDYILITFADTGIGMDTETKRRIFDPFFTTKGVRGTGLGLSVSYGIVRRHNGSISVDSQINKGTTVTIRLPLCFSQETEKKESEKTAAAEEIDSTAKILVVDDEEDPRELLKDILEIYGHTVLTASSGKEALDILAKHSDIRIIFTDLGMPEMSGWDLSKSIKKSSPEAVIVVITGWGTQLDRQRLQDCGISQVIAKPFRVNQIKELVSNCIQRANSCQ